MSKFQLPNNIVTELIPWKTVHVDLIGPNTKKIKQEQPDCKIKVITTQLTCMTFIDPATGWFEIAEVPYFKTVDTEGTSMRHIDKTSARISLLFKKHWLDRYPRPQTVIFDNGSEFKKNFIPLLQDFSIKPKVTTVKNPQANAPVERIHQIVT